MSKMQVNKDQIIISSWWDNLRFHLRRGKGHLPRYLLNRWRWHNQPKRRKVSEYPEHIDMELASACNMKCPMCYTITDRFKKEVPRKIMPFEVYKKILDEIGGKVFSIRLSLRGEATLHKDYVRIMEYAKKVGIQEVSSLTNALKLDEKMMRAMIQAPLDWLTVSVDGIDETYNKIRFPAKFEDLVAKLTRFHELKKEMGASKPVIKIQGIWPAIQNDAERYFEIFHPIVDQVASNQLVDYLGNDDKKKIKYKKDFECPAIYQRLVIGSDGTALFCHNDLFNQHPIGNVMESSIKELWHSEGMQAIRKAHKEHRGVESYAACQACYLPRAMEEVEVTHIGGNKVKVDKYAGREQVVGK